MCQSWDSSMQMHLRNCLSHAPCGPHMNSPWSVSFKPTASNCSIHLLSFSALAATFYWYSGTQGDIWRFRTKVVLHLLHLPPQWYSVIPQMHLRCLLDCAVVNEAKAAAFATLVCWNNPIANIHMLMGLSNWFPSFPHGTPYQATKAQCSQHTHTHTRMHRNNKTRQHHQKNRCNSMMF